MRASARPSVKKQAIAPSGSATVVCRTPVRSPTPIGGAEQAVTGSCAGGPSRMGGGWPAQEKVRVPSSGS